MGTFLVRPNIQRWRQETEKETNRMRLSEAKLNWNSSLTENRRK